MVIGRVMDLTKKTLVSSNPTSIVFDSKSRSLSIFICWKAR